eukprot:3685248-Amphidinium_carterae.1
MQAYERKQDYKAAMQQVHDNPPRPDRWAAMVNLTYEACTLLMNVTCAEGGLGLAGRSIPCFSLDNQRTGSSPTSTGRPGRDCLQVNHEHCGEITKVIWSDGASCYTLTLQGEPWLWRRIMRLHLPASDIANCLPRRTRQQIMPSNFHPILRHAITLIYKWQHALCHLQLIIY